jgi:hypothetical protein
MAIALSGERTSTIEKDSSHATAHAVVMAVSPREIDAFLSLGMTSLLDIESISRFPLEVDRFVCLVQQLAWVSRQRCAY